MTRDEARKLIKSKNMNASSTAVLLRVLDLTYRKGREGDPEAITEATSATYQKAAKIKTRQLFNVITKLEADKVLLDVETGCKIRCRLNLEAIQKLAPYVPEKPKADRAEKAREKRAEIRELNRVITAYKDAADKDRADILTKMLLLQNVKDPQIKRAMMQWDHDRIRRAKENAEKLLAGVTQ